MKNVSEELLDVVDVHDRVVEVATRADIHARRLRHRAVHILVVRPQGDIYVQRRALHKDCAPGLWDSSAAGHVAHGEDYDSAAPRELSEELGLVDVPLEPLCRLAANTDTGFEFVRAYACVTSREPVPDTWEIAEGAWRSPHELEALIKRRPQHFTDSFKLIFSQYLQSLE